MIVNNRLLIVGGAGRNVGKTEFVCRLIEKFARQQEIYGLKVSSIFPDEELYHGTHPGDEPARHLFEETRTDTSKDTSRMLRAGAARVFYLRSDDAGIKEIFSLFLGQLPEGALIVSESNSLSQFVRPGLHVMVRAVDGQVKPRARAQLEGADLVVVSDGVSGFPELDRIELDGNREWQLKN
jgi:hypothetical protein